MNNHDEHYRKIEDESTTEPIVVMEELAERMIDNNVDTKSVVNIVLAQKHITRAGVKKGNGWEQEIEKAINYLTRALTGHWIK